MGLELAVALTDYWLGRQPAEGLERIGRLVDAATPSARCARSPCSPAATSPTGSRTLPWAPRSSTRPRVFASLGDPLGEGGALRRGGAIAAATDDLRAAGGFLEASLERLEASGVEREVGTTLLHLGSFLADEGPADEALPALERARVSPSRPATRPPTATPWRPSPSPHWKAGQLDAAMQTGTRPSLIFHEVGDRRTEGTVAYRCRSIARGLGGRERRGGMRRSRSTRAGARTRGRRSRSGISTWRGWTSTAATAATPRHTSLKPSS